MVILYSEWYLFQLIIFALFDTSTCVTLGQHYEEICMLKSMVVNKYFQTWHLIGWQHSRQPIRSHVRKSLLTSMEFNMDFT